MNRWIKTLCFVIVFLCVLSVSVFAGSEETATHPIEVSEEIVLQRIEKLEEALGGKYFTVNRKSCGSERSHGCSNCGMLNVVDTKWFNKVVGFAPVDNNYYPNHYFLKHKYTWGMSCCGFANYAGWYIYAQKETDNVVYNNKGTYFFNEKNADKYLEPGDIVRLDGAHSAVYISNNEDGIEVLDCNWRTDGTNCEVRRHIIEYSKYALMCISRALNHENESKINVEIVHSLVPEESVKIPFREGESVSVDGFGLKMADYYQIGWATKPNAKKVEFSMRESFSEPVKLFPVWKKFDNQRFVVIGVAEMNVVLIGDNAQLARFEILEDLPVGVQKDGSRAFFDSLIVASEEYRACIEGNKKNRKYIVVFVKNSSKSSNKKVLDVVYTNNFDYKKFDAEQSKKFN